MTGRGAVALGLVALALAPAAAAAQEVTRAGLRDLAARARSDPEALEELRAVERVDGVPADLGRALAGADGEALERRLEALAEGAGARAAPVEPQARRDARAILAERRFQEPDVPRPFRRPLAWLGERLRPLVDAFDRMAEALPGGSATLWGILGALVVGLVALLAARIARRRAADAVERGRAATRTTATDARRLEEEAADAERRGDLERALRLLFRAGLLRLDRSRAIVLRDSLTTGQLRRALRSREFDTVARVFDEVTYGRRPPEPADVEASRSGWRRVLEQAGAR